MHTFSNDGTLKQSLYFDEEVSLLFVSTTRLTSLGKLFNCEVVQLLFLLYAMVHLSVQMLAYILGADLETKIS